MKRIALFLAAFVISLAILLTEGWTPLGFSHGLFYIFPMLLLRHQLLALQATAAGFMTVMILLGFLGSPPGLDQAYVIVNRLLSGVALWALILVQLDGRGQPR